MKAAIIATTAEPPDRSLGANLPAPARRLPRASCHRPVVGAPLLALLLLIMAGDSPAADLAERITVRGDVRTRWLQVDVDGNPPQGLFGEPLTQGTSFLHRIFLEVEARATERISAGGLLRLSNEPDRILTLGPDYFSRPEGSVFIAGRWPSVGARAGYYRAHFTPLTLMRWDREDIGLGGAQRACAVCGGAAAGVLVESLEELDKDLTFEGARVDGQIGVGLDWTVLYARPKEATLDLSDVSDPLFQYHQDLYAARAVFSRLHPPTLSFRRLGATVFAIRDEADNPECPSLPQSPTCWALDQRAFGIDYRLPLGRRVVLEGEWLRTAHLADARGDSLPRVWSNALRITGSIVILPEKLTLKSAYLRLATPVGSPYSALTYVGNRTGQRHRLIAELKPVTVDGFFRFTAPVSEEWIALDRARLEDEWTASAQVGIDLPYSWRVLAGYQFERTGLETLPGWSETYRRYRREIELLEIAYELKAFTLAFDQQWIWQEDPEVDLGTGNATITSLTAKALF